MKSCLWKVFAHTVQYDRDNIEQPFQKLFFVAEVTTVARTLTYIIIFFGFGFGFLASPWVTWQTNVLIPLEISLWSPEQKYRRTPNR